MKLDERMRTYESRFKPYLIPGLPAIIRVDMRAGHTFCRDLDRPLDAAFSRSMRAAALALCEAVSGAILAYTQSDEISVAVRHIVDEHDMSQFFAGNIVKIASVTASICTAAFNRKFTELEGKTHPELAGTAQFDSRVFNVPNLTELHNYFVWRQADAERNSLGMLSRSLYSTKELHGKKRPELHDMCMAKGVNWNDLDPAQKRGVVLIRDGRNPGWYNVDVRFSREPDYIRNFYIEGFGDAADDEDHPKFREMTRLEIAAMLGMARREKADAQARELKDEEIG